MSKQTPDLFLSSPHPLMWELFKSVLGDLWYSALDVTAFKNICYFRKCIKFLWTLGKGCMGSQLKRHLPDPFPTCSFPQLSSQSAGIEQRTAAPCVQQPIRVGGLPKGTHNFPSSYLT